jgi:hypothetical protein
LARPIRSPLRLNLGGSKQHLTRPLCGKFTERSGRGRPLDSRSACHRFDPVPRRVTEGTLHDWKDAFRRACCRRRPSFSWHLSRCWVVLPRGPEPMRRVCAPLQPGRGQSGLSPPYLRQPRCRPIIWFCPIAGRCLAGGAELSSLMQSRRCHRMDRSAA